MSAPFEFIGSHYCGVLDHLVTSRGRSRLLFMISGGMTPDEVRPWVQPPPKNWLRVEWMLYVAFERTARTGGRPVPPHLRQWLADFEARAVRPLIERTTAAG